MDNIFLLVIIGFFIGTIGTLIGAGGGFILVPLLILSIPSLNPDSITAISMGVVACNAISGSVAYIKAKRVDFKAGIIFAICTIPGSILGVLTTKVISKQIFDLLFGTILIGLAFFLFIKGQKKSSRPSFDGNKKGWISQNITDKNGEVYNYSYNIRNGIFLSILVGYLSPLLGIGGGIIHVPAMTEWLMFPVHVATATSHFILAIMSTVSVITHYFQGSYNDPLVIKLLVGLAVGVIPGAQVGAYLSHRLKGKIIVRSLAVCLAIVGVRIFFSAL